MDEFVQLIRNKLSDSRSHLTIVRNTDGFLLRPDTQQAMLDKGNILLMPIQSALELRVRYELKDSFYTNCVLYHLARHRSCTRFDRKDYSKRNHQPVRLHAYLQFA